MNFNVLSPDSHHLEPVRSFFPAGGDADFLRAAFHLSRNAVYSLHKSSTRDYIQRLAEKELRAASGKRLSCLPVSLLGRIASLFVVLCL